MNLIVIESRFKRISSIVRSMGHLPSCSPSSRLLFKILPCLNSLSLHSTSIVSLSTSLFVPRSFAFAKIVVLAVEHRRRLRHRFAVFRISPSPSSRRRPRLCLHPSRKSIPKKDAVQKTVHGDGGSSLRIACRDRALFCLMVYAMGGTVVAPKGFAPLGALGNAPVGTSLCRCGDRFLGCAFLEWFLSPYQPGLVFGQVSPCS
ncbi:hypothetical protein OUZ56_004002 [Daphnia magna]|uniref:Uncharacterized protein n=1 Tax=Daphnia magna TaxID=35525 RepID=A0ABQ9YNU4_9CRUS|nr:hypothetical protein OUZ56_004002 [Daphnia magna]